MDFTEKGFYSSLYSQLVVLQEVNRYLEGGHFGVVAKRRYSRLGVPVMHVILEG